MPAGCVVDAATALFACCLDDLLLVAAVHQGQILWLSPEVVFPQPDMAVPSRGSIGFGSVGKGHMDSHMDKYGNKQMKGKRKKIFLRC
jgi:hypothetical protein